MSGSDPIISVEELKRRGGEAVVLGFELGFDLSKAAILLKTRLHTGQDRSFLIPTLSLAGLCETIAKASELPGWKRPGPNNAPTIEGRDWQPGGQSIVRRVIVAVASNGALVGIRLDGGQSRVLTMPPPLALAFAAEVQDGFQRGDLIDLAADQTGTPS